MESKSCIGTEAEAEKFFNEVYEVENKTGKRAFKRITKERTPAIEEEFLKRNKTAANMAELFEGEEAKKVFNNFKTDPFYYAIEQKGLKLFGNILDCWTEYEIFKHSKMAKDEFDKFGNNKYWQKPNLPEAKSELIEDIEPDKRFFVIDGLNVPATLKNAVVLSNLFHSVRDKRWFEILNSLDISEKGRHFIHYLTTKNKKN